MGNLFENLMERANLGSGAKVFFRLFFDFYSDFNLVCSR